MKFEDLRLFSIARMAPGSPKFLQSRGVTHALMKTRREALAELSNVFEMIEDEYREKGQKHPADSTEIVDA
jgi:hypothetical protein